MHAKTAGFVPPKLKLIFVGGSMAGVQVKPLFPAESSEIDLTEMKKKKNYGKESNKIFVCSTVHTVQPCGTQKQLPTSYQNTVFTECSTEQRPEGLDGIAGES